MCVISKYSNVFQFAKKNTNLLKITPNTWFYLTDIYFHVFHIFLLHQYSLKSKRINFLITIPFINV